MAKGNSKTLFVGGLSINITEQELRQYFEQFTKELKITLLKNRDNGKSKGYAFVTIKDISIAQEISSMRHVILGRQVECQIAARKCEKEENNHERASRKLYVSNIHPMLSARKFRDFFSFFGEIHNCYIIRNPELNCNRNYGFVEFEDPRVAKYLLSSVTPLEIEGAKVYICQYKDKADFGNKDQSYPQNAAENIIYSSIQALQDDRNLGFQSQITGSNRIQNILNPKLCSKEIQKNHSKKQLTFLQRYPIKGENIPDETGKNYHLRIVYNKDAKEEGFQAPVSVPFYSSSSGRFQIYNFNLGRCGHCHNFNPNHIVTSSKQVRAAHKADCSKVYQDSSRDSSLFFKGSSSGLLAADCRTGHVQDGNGLEKVNDPHCSIYGGQ